MLIKGALAKLRIMKRVGIFSGSFDPVHKGHVAFALSALESSNLDVIYFAPEARPRHKPSVTHLSHRIAMLKLATRMHPKLKVLELEDKQFLPATTLPRLKQRFPHDELILLLGSDLLEHLHSWPRVEFLLKNVSLIIGVRGTADVAESLGNINALEQQPRGLHIVESLEPAMASRNIRQSIREGHNPRDILPSVYVYAKKHWLYDSVSMA